MRDSYRLVSGIVFGLVTIAQAVRLFNQWSVQIGPITIPMWFSLAAVVVAGGLCAWAFMGRRA
jgi:hypothetical protein